MYNGYLARYEYLHTTFKEMAESYRNYMEYLSTLTRAGI